jgi:hypothetical protein
LDGAGKSGGINEQRAHHQASSRLADLYSDVRGHHQNTRASADIRSIAFDVGHCGGRSIALLVIFHLGEAAFGAPQYADKLVGFAELLVPGAVVTRLARNYGVEKSGWFGVGAKATFWLLLFIVVLVGGGFAVRYLLAR